MWSNVDERNLSLLFWNTGEQETSKRLVDLLKIQAESERLSKQRKRKRRQPKLDSKNTEQAQKVDERTQPPEEANFELWQDYENPFEVTMTEEQLALDLQMQTPGKDDVGSVELGS